MNKEILGALVIGVLVLTAISRWRGAPDKGDYRAATNAFPRLHLYKGPEDANQSIDVLDAEGHRAGRLVFDDGRLYVPKDGSLRAVVTSDLYLIDPGWDLGTFGGYRDDSSITVDRLAVGLRVSPCRLLYGTTAPDLVLAKDWAGAGASFYLPSQLVGATASHIGVGAWYGVPFSDGADSGGAAWCYGLSFSTRH